MQCVTSQVIARLPSPQSDSRSRAGKRKRDRDTAQPAEEERLQKRNRPVGTITSFPIPEEDSNHHQYGADVDWKAILGQWPPSREQERSMSKSTSNKRSRSSSTSFRQQVREGSSPVQWTKRHAKQMQDGGVVIGTYAHLAVLHEDSQKLCKDLLEKEYSIPNDSIFKLDRLTRNLDRVQFLNESRVVRDITPILVPSPELLYFDGNDELAHISETLNSLWTQCDLLGGPMPKPDMVVGISPSAFSQEERDKLKMCHTSACPNLFPEDIYFPFLICEVKQSDESIEKAERQALHSASIAVRAVIQLYKKTSLINEVDQKILAFSVAHNHSVVKFFGHFAKLDGDKMTFFRHRLFSQEFADETSSGNWTKAYQISRAIYQVFFPKHLARIKDALSEMRAPILASFTGSLGLEESQDSIAESSQEDSSFKKPDLPTTVLLRQENDKLLEVIRELQAQVSREHQAENKREREELIEQMAQQKEEAQEQKREAQEQKKEAQEQKKEAQEQKKEAQEQKKMWEQQLEQQREIIRLLKETRSN